jgi:hypothetical protein
MKRPPFLMLAAFAGLGAPAAPAMAAESVPAEGQPSALCRFHGAGCEAPPAEWSWQRLEPRVGGFSVELPCDAKQANAFGQVLAISRAKFPAANTRACMKATSGFTATLIGFVSLPDDTQHPDIDNFLSGAPDMFTAFLQRGLGKGVPETTLKGRRAIMNTIEKPEGRSKVAIVELGRFGIVMLTADIRSQFPGTREEADAAMERFVGSLEITE